MALPWDLIFVVSSTAIGVFLSFLIPTLKQYRQSIKATGFSATNTRWMHFMNAAAPYAIIAIQSFLIAIVVVAILLQQGTILTHWYEALVAGNTFDSTIQKVST